MPNLYKITVRDKNTNKALQIHERYAGNIDPIVKEEFEKNPTVRITIALLQPAK